MFEEQDLTTHHAYLLEGEKGPVLSEVLALIERTEGMRHGAHPDLFLYDIEALLLEHAQDMRLHEKQSALMGGTKLFIAAFASATHEAQNAMLKMLEEPSASSRFYFIIPNAELLLPTVRSRMRQVSVKKQDARTSDVFRDQVKRFLGGSTLERMQIVAPMIEREGREDAKQFLDALLREAHAQVPQNERFLRDIIAARGYLADRSPSKKMLLEHLALTF